jgi:Caspase domain
MKLLGKLFILACVLSWTFANHAQVQGESRLALLIGNATYKSSPLKNPVNDVRLMESALTDAGFTVIKAENASRREMQRIVRDFGERLKQSGGVGLFYFAGHGVQVKGANYLVPVDADIRAEDEVAFDSIDAQSVLEKMETAKNRINLLILDACRDNPFAKGSRSGTAGLATMSAPSGSLVAYSTSPGSVASDGAGNNGLYTQHLAAVMRMPDMPIEEVFKRVRANVRKDSANQQTPWENTALEGNFYFKKSPPVVVAAVAPTLTPMAATAAPTAPAAPNMMMVELAYWESIKTSNRPFELEAYIEQFPSGAFVGLAKARLRSVAEEITKARTAQTAAAAIQKEPGMTVAAIKPTPITPPSLSSLNLNVTQGASLGVLQINDRIFNSKSELKLTLVEKTNAFSLFNSGDKISANGQVMQVRFGENIVSLRRGELWRFPLKAGDKGKADIKMGNFDGDMEWQIKPDTASGNLIVQAEYRYILPNFGGAARYGVWTGSYEANQITPTDTKYTQFGGGRNVLVTTSLVSN